MLVVLVRYKRAAVDTVRGYVSEWERAQKRPKSIEHGGRTVGQAKLCATEEERKDVNDFMYQSGKGGVGSFLDQAVRTVERRVWSCEGVLRSKALETCGRVLGISQEDTRERLTEEGARRV